MRLLLKDENYSILDRKSTRLQQILVASFTCKGVFACLKGTAAKKTNNKKNSPFDFIGQKWWNIWKDTLCQNMVGCVGGQEGECT